MSYDVQAILDAFRGGDTELIRQALERYEQAAVGPRVALISDQKADGVNAGDATNAWTTRDLNTLVDPNEIVAGLTGNAFTLGPGSYLIEASAPAYQCGHHQLRLYSVTAAAVAIVGSSGLYLDPDRAADNHAFLAGILNLVDTEQFQLQHNTQFGGSNGFGVAGSFGVGEIYSQVKITTVAGT